MHFWDSFRRGRKGSLVERAVDQTYVDACLEAEKTMALWLVMVKLEEENTVAAEASADIVAP
jgi:hypothetical protein